MPEVLRERRQNPQGQPIIFKRAFGEDQTAFSYLGSNPSSLADFNNLMAGQRYGRKDWFDFFPVQEKLLDGFTGGPLLVDVGGSEGYELQCFKETFPSAKGDLVLQDLPVVIDRIQNLDSDIIRMEHDFFTPQPVKGMILTPSTSPSNIRQALAHTISGRSFTTGTTRSVAKSCRI